MANIDYPNGLSTAGQFPLDGKRQFKTLNELTDLGTGSSSAFKYYEDMIVQCIEDHKQYIWREAINSEIGIIPSNFIYPVGAIANGIDYSNRPFNFFEVANSGGGTGPTKTSQLQNDGDDGTNPFIAENDIADLNEYDSLALATTALGLDKLFRYSDSNLDGVPSPNGSIIGITK